MKKFLFVCVIMFIVNMGCKKTDFDGSAPCGCSVLQGPFLLVSIKNTAGADMLDANNAGAYIKEKIQVYRKDAAGKEIPANFTVRPPANYGDNKVTSYQLNIAGFNFTPQPAINVLYLKLGEGKPYELKVEFDSTSRQITKLFIEQKEVERNAGTEDLALYTFIL